MRRHKRDFLYLKIRPYFVRVNHFLDSIYVLPKGLPTAEHFRPPQLGKIENRKIEILANILMPNNRLDILL